jgi:hypothetical protein
MKSYLRIAIVFGLIVAGAVGTASSALATCNGFYC